MSLLTLCCVLCVTGVRCTRGSVCRQGDYLAQNAQNGEQWPIAREQFESMYEAVEVSAASPPRGKRDLHPHGAAPGSRRRNEPRKLPSSVLLWRGLGHVMRLGPHGACGGAANARILTRKTCLNGLGLPRRSRRSVPILGAASRSC